MKVDELIIQSFEKEVSDLDLSDDTYSKMLNYIENHSEEEKSRTNPSILSKIGTYMSKLRLTWTVQVALLAMILILTTSILNQKQSSKVEAIMNTNKGVFVDKIEQLIRNSHSSETSDNALFMLEEEITNPKRIAEECPFDIEYPDYIPEGYKLNKVVLNKAKSENDENIKGYIVRIEYKDKNRNYIYVEQWLRKKPLSMPIAFVYNGGGERLNINGFQGIIRDKNQRSDFSELSFWSNDKGYYISAKDNNYRDELIKVAKSFKFMSDPSYLPKEQYDFYFGLDKVKSVIPFDLETPKYYPEECKLEYAQANIIKRSEGTLYSLWLTFTRNLEHEFRISIINESEKPEEILKKCTEVKLGNLNAWVYPAGSVGDENQVMFWKNGLYYNVASRNLDIETLKKIAESYDDSYSKEVASEYIELKKEISTEILSMLEKNNTIMVTKLQNGIITTDMKLYNTERLDDFIEDFSNGKPSKVRVIKYTESDKVVKVDSLMDIEFNGKRLKSIEYDINSNKDAYIPTAPKYYNNITKYETSKTLGYLFLDGKDISKDRREYIIKYEK